MGVGGRIGNIIDVGCAVYDYIGSIKSGDGILNATKKLVFNFVLGKATDKFVFKPIDYLTTGRDLKTGFMKNANYIMDSGVYNSYKRSANNTYNRTMKMAVAKNTGYYIGTSAGQVAVSTVIDTYTKPTVPTYAPFIPVNSPSYKPKPNTNFAPFIPYSA